MGSNDNMLKVAIEMQKVELLKSALQDGHNPNGYIRVAKEYRPDECIGYSTLEYCLRHDFIDGVVILLENGADPAMSAYEENKHSFLYSFVDSILYDRVSKKEVMRVFETIEKCDIDALFIKSNNETGLVEYALTKHHFADDDNGTLFSVIHMLLGLYDERELSLRSRLLLLPRNYNEDLIRFLISEGADVNAVGEQGETPMHRVVKYMGVNGDKKRDAVQILLENGAKPNTRDENNKLPIDYINPQPQNIDVGELIISYGGYKSDTYIDTRDVFVVRNNAEYCLSEFLLNRKNEDIESAFKLSKEDIARNPESPYSIVLYGRVLVCMDKTDLLDAHLEGYKCCFQNEEFDVCNFVWWEIINLAQKLKKYNVARKYFEKLHGFTDQIWEGELNENLLEAFYDYGVALSLSGDDKVASEVLNAIWCKRDQIPTPWLDRERECLANLGSLLGSLIVGKGDYVRGELILIEAMEYDIHNKSLAKKYLAYCYMKQDMFDDAIRLAKEYLVSNPKSVLIWNVLAKSNYLVGDKVEANVAASESLRIDPRNAFAMKIYDITKGL